MAVEWVEENGGRVEYEYPEWSDNIPDSWKRLVPRKVVGVDLSGVTVKGINRLALFPDLKYLDISRCKVNDISALKGLVKLEVLTLRGTNVSDFSALKGLVQLRYLNLRGTNLRGADLRGANLTGVDLTDAKGLTLAQINRAIFDL